MSHQEACQVFIEQEIDKGLKEGKTPYSIGKDLTVWLEKLFEAKIPPKTIAKRAERIKNELATNVASESTQEHHREIGEIQDSQVGHGGSREGAGRPTKFADPEITEPNESESLTNLKLWWRKTNEKDRSIFLNWINQKWERRRSWNQNQSKIISSS